MGPPPELLAAIVRKVLSAAAPRRIILFGSAATGRMGADSDIDLLIVEDRIGDSRAESVRLRRAIGSIGYPVDVLVMGEERFQETKDFVGGLAFPASKYGKTLYEAT